ncbi:MAG TPA: cell division protein FtsQ [Saprospiraceae bacterium]|nr:cell division protein FtsQ [Saprospiraceae bacterium]HND87838.1 cell division protein FtsQ [Saprospiraceae bacterium]
MQLPRLRYDRLTWLLFLFVVLAIWYLARQRKANTFAEGVEVQVEPLASGDKLISERDVRQALLRSFGNTLEGTELANLEVERMERVLEEDPFVRNADAYIDQNNQLHVRIEQREPVLRVLDNNGGNYYLDAAGKKMPPSKNFAARVLVATGNVAPYTPEFREKRKSNLKDLFNLTQTLLADDFLSAFIQQVHINNAGEFILVPLVGDQKIVLGSTRRLEDKLRRLKIFYLQGMPYEGWRKYETINLKYSGQVVCRR